MRAKSLSVDILKNTIKGWGLHCKEDINYKWTKHDSNAMLMLIREVKRQQNIIYLKRKALKMNPYINKKTPYRTT